MSKIIQCTATERFKSNPNFEKFLEEAAQHQVDLLGVFTVELVEPINCTPWGRIQTPIPNSIWYLFIANNEMQEYHPPIANFSYMWGVFAIGPELTPPSAPLTDAQKLARKKLQYSIEKVRQVRIEIYTQIEFLQRRMTETLKKLQVLQNALERNP